MGPRILFIQQEWGDDFRRSTQWAWCAGLGYVEALEAAGCAVTLLTTPWLRHAPDLLKDREFDQVWVCDLVHLEVEPGFFAWLRERAPVRLGLVCESLRYTDEELREEPRYAPRFDRVRLRAAGFTHLALYDELDAEWFQRGGAAAIWNPGAFPRALVVAADEVQPRGWPGFIGAVYPKRVRFFRHPALDGRVAHITPRDRPPEVEARHQQIAALAGCTPDSLAGLRALHARYQAEHLACRRDIYRRYLDALRTCGVLINPPTLVKSYPGRVFEGAAQGIPVVSWRIPDRPKNAVLFRDGSEILLAGDPPATARALDRLQGDPEFARALALRARERLLADYTLEARCRTLLRFTSARR